MKLNQQLVARGIQALLLRILLQSTKKQKDSIEFFEKTFENMKEFRKQASNDQERLDDQIKELREWEAEKPEE